MGAGAKTRLESRMKKFTPHCICRRIPVYEEEVPLAQASPFAEGTCTVYALGPMRSVCVRAHALYMR